MKSSSIMFRIVPGLVVLGMLLAPGVSHAFDRDGERVRAHRFGLDKAVTDSVTAVTDANDWHYVELMGDGQLTVTVTVTPGSSNPTISITNASGEELVTSSSAPGGEHRLTVKAVAGVYYIHIASGTGESKYTMTAHVD